MGDWIRGWLEYLKTPEGSELRHHGIIGGTVGVLLTIFEVLHPRQIKSVSDVLMLLVSAFAVFIVGFVLLTLGEYWIQRTKPMKLDCGVVDGYWIYAVRDVNSDDRRFDRGSIVRIQTSGTGFLVSGHAYLRKQLEHPELIERHGRLGEFKGTGSPRKNTGRIYFHFEGSEIDDHGNERIGYGVGYYNFFQYDNDLRMTGIFTGSGLGEKDSPVANREVRGQRIATNIQEREFDTKGDRQSLLALLENLDKQPEEVRIQFRSAGIIDGRWVDAIYEKRGGEWTLIQGSDMEFHTVAVTQRMWVSGCTYDYEWLAAATDLDRVPRPHDFQGQGRRMDRYEGFYYEYGGTEGLPEFGTGYYRFRMDPRGASFEGAFLRGPGHSYRLVYGIRINDNLSESERTLALSKHLADCQTHMPNCIRRAIEAADYENQAARAMLAAGKQPASPQP